jgi:tripartite-type tricarboxylate transporter receptor subunit TctC
MNSNRRRACAAVVGGMLASSLAPALSFAADSYPTRPLRIIVAYGPGSGADTVARILSEHLSTALKTSVVIDNREGAGGAIGTQAAARSAADGYTLLFAPTTLTVSPHLQSAVKYDPVKDFAPIMRVAILPLAVVTSQKAPFNTLAGLIDYAKAHPGELSYATSGKGSPSHLEMELLRKRYGLDIRDVPYRNVGQAMTDTISGQVSFYFPTFPSALPHITSGNVRGLAIGSATRSEKAPTLPTIAEALGLPSYESNVWYGLLAPAGTPKDIVTRLYAETSKLLDNPQIKKQIEDTGAVVWPMATEPFTAFIKSENAKWGGLVQELGLKDQQ